MVILHKPCAASAERCRRSGARYAGLCTLKKDDGRFRRRNARSHCLWQRTHQLTQNIITYILPICGTRNSGPAIPSVSGRVGDGTFRVPIVGLRGFYGYGGYGRKKKHFDLLHFYTLFSKDHFNYVSVFSVSSSSEDLTWVSGTLTTHSRRWSPSTRIHMTIMSSMRRHGRMGRFRLMKSKSTHTSSPV